MVHSTVGKTLERTDRLACGHVGENDSLAVLANVRKELRGMTHIFKDSAANNVVVSSRQTRINSGIKIANNDIRGNLDDVAGLILTPALQVTLQCLCSRSETTD